MAVNGNSTIWIVREQMQGGYMPDSISFSATKQSAFDNMRFLKQTALDEDYKVSGSLKEGYYSLMPKDASEYTLGRSIVLQSASASIYLANIKQAFETKDDLADYLNNHYSL